MPIYDYKCCKCKKEFERIVKTAEEVVICDCNYLATKQTPTKFSFRLNGGGWAKDGYTKENKNDKNN